MSSGNADDIWVLREASKPGGFSPNALSAANFAKSLERDGLLYRSDRGPRWEITQKGRARLAELIDVQRGKAGR